MRKLIELIMWVRRRLDKQIRRHRWAANHLSIYRNLKKIGKEVR